MQIKQTHKYKRYVTQPREPQYTTESQYPRRQNSTLKELKIQVSNMNQGMDSTLGHQSNQKGCVNRQKQFYHGISHHIHDRIKQKRQALRRLPEISNSLYNNYNDKHNNSNSISNNTQKMNNPLFIVNSLFQIMKEDIVLNNKSAKHKQKHKNDSTLTENHSRNNVENQKMNNMLYHGNAQCLGSKSIKINRAPRLINNELNRLNNHTKLMNNRRIYSEQKRRPKMDSSGIDILTFYRPKGANWDQQKSVNSKWQVILPSDIQYQENVGLLNKQFQQNDQNQFL